VAALVCVGALIAACGSGDDSDASGASDASDATAAPATTSASGADPETTSTSRRTGGTDGPSDVGDATSASGQELCSAFPLSEMADVTGLPLTLQEPDEIGCTYKVAEAKTNQYRTVDLTSFSISLSDPDDAATEQMLADTRQQCVPSSVRQHAIPGADEAFTCAAVVMSQRVDIASAVGGGVRVNVVGSHVSPDFSEETFHDALAKVMALVFGRR